MKRKREYICGFSCDIVLKNESGKILQFKGGVYAFGHNSSVATTGSTPPAFLSIPSNKICD